MIGDDGASERYPNDWIPSNPTVTDCSGHLANHCGFGAISAASNCASFPHSGTRANWISTVHRRNFSDSTADCSSSMPDCWSANEIRNANASPTVNATWTVTETETGSGKHDRRRRPLVQPGRHRERPDWTGYPSRSYWKPTNRAGNRHCPWFRWLCREDHCRFNCTHGYPLFRFRFGGSVCE